MHQHTPGPYYILIEEGKEPKVSVTEPDIHPSELETKRVLFIDGLQIQEWFFKGMMRGWTIIERI